MSTNGSLNRSAISHTAVWVPSVKMDTYRFGPYQVHIRTRQIHDKDMDNALQLYEELHSRNLSSNVPAPLRLRIARHLEASNYWEGAAQEYNNLWSSGLTDALSFQALMAHASLMLKQKKKKEALQLFETAYKSSFPHMDWDITISNGLQQAGALPEETAGGAASGKT